jgi:DNA-directed RNA polymerase subunit N (RpoN/RPB10)
VRYGTDDTTRYFEADGHHEAIIDATTYYQVQEKIGKVERVSPTKHPTSGVYFCGVLYCEICGAKYSTHWNYKGERQEDGRRKAAYPSYRCMGIDKKCCNAKMFSHNKAERAFEQYIDNYDSVALLANKQAETPKQDNSADIANIAAEIRQIEKKTEEIMHLFVTNAIDFVTYQGMVKVSNERRGELEARKALLENAQAAKDVVYTTSDIIANFRDNWKALNGEQRQQFVQKFVKKVITRCEAPKGAKNSEVIVDDIIFNEF